MAPQLTAAEWALLTGPVRDTWPLLGQRDLDDAAGDWNALVGCIARLHEADRAEIEERLLQIAARALGHEAADDEDGFDFSALDEYEEVVELTEDDILEGWDEDDEVSPRARGPGEPGDEAR